MRYLVKRPAPPQRDSLSEAEQRYLEQHFDAHPAELTVNHQVIPWHTIEEVEVARAARQKTLSGWLVRNVIYHEERYHVGIYVTGGELVLTNITLATVGHIVGCIAAYMQTPVRYSGVEGITPVETRD